MNLIIFDIDGTLVDSLQVDDQCFIQTFEDLYNIDLSKANWNDFEHVTDSGITAEVFQLEFKRAPLANELNEIKKHFFQLLLEQSHKLEEVKGAIDTINYLDRHPNYAIAIATGGWEKTARLKLKEIGLEQKGLVMVTADDSFSRREITESAISISLFKLGLQRFDSITYVGDGLWDYETAKELGIGFIGVDSQQNDKLTKAGSNRVISDFANFKKYIS